MTNPAPDAMPIFCTMRDGGNDIHLECRFTNGEKYAAVLVDNEKPELAAFLMNCINTRAAQPSAADVLAIRHKIETQFKHWADISYLAFNITEYLAAQGHLTAKPSDEFPVWHCAKCDTETSGHDPYMCWENDAGEQERVCRNCLTHDELRETFPSVAKPSIDVEALEILKETANLTMLTVGVRAKEWIKKNAA